MAKVDEGVRAALTDKVIDDIRTELAYAHENWGDAFDDKNTANDWIAYIVHYAGCAVTLPWSPQVFREMLVKVAGLCISAIVRLDDGGGSLPKRHYD